MFNFLNLNKFDKESVNTFFILQIFFTLIYLYVMFLYRYNFSIFKYLFILYFAYNIGFTIIATNNSILGKKNIFPGLDCFGKIISHGLVYTICCLTVLSPIILICAGFGIYGLSIMLAILILPVFPALLIIILFLSIFTIFYSNFCVSLKIIDLFSIPRAIKFLKIKRILKIWLASPLTIALVFWVPFILIPTSELLIIGDASLDYKLIILNLFLAIIISFLSTLIAVCMVKEISKFIKEVLRANEKQERKKVIKKVAKPIQNQ